MVKVPVVTTLAIDEPEIMPVRPEATTPALAGPPRYLPSREKATWMKKPPAPAFSSRVPNSTNMNTTLVDTPSATPKMPSEVSHIRSEEHTSELQSLMRISSAVFCLKKKK